MLNKISEEHPTIYRISLLAITVVGATLLAIFIGVVKQKGFIEWLFAKMRVNKIHPVPTAWDYYFSKQEESWIIVTLKNGKTIYGKFSEHTFPLCIKEKQFFRNA